MLSEYRLCRLTTSIALASCVTTMTMAAQPNANLLVTLFEKSLIRSPGSPETGMDTSTFVLRSDVKPPFKLLVVNGESTGQNRISSADIIINGHLIVRPSDLNENVFMLERDISLDLINTVVAELRSKPGAFLKFSITGTLDWSVLVNPALHVSIYHPPGWDLLTGSDPDVLNISNVKTLSPESDAALAAESLFQLRLIRNANAAAFSSASTWFDKYFANGFAVPVLSRSNMLVNGRSAVRIEVSEIGRTAHFYVLVGQDVMEISYGLFNSTFVPQYESMLRTLQFTL